MAPNESAVEAATEEAISPKGKAPMEEEVEEEEEETQNDVDASHKPPGTLGDDDTFEERTDPDAQATVTDFLDFTEYLPSDMIRSLTLIGKLDQTYLDASVAVHDATTTWGQLPSLPADDRPSAVQLRADISRGLNRVVGSRVSAHAEAVRMAENVNRHCKRAKTILSKMQTMMENYPTAEELKSPVIVPKSPPVARAPKPTLRTAQGQKIRRQMIPRITVPGEVLAPYDRFEAYSTDSEDSSDQDDIESVPRRTPARTTPAPRIKVIKVPKAGTAAAATGAGAGTAASKLPKTPKPPSTAASRAPKSAPAGTTVAPGHTPASFALAGPSSSQTADQSADYAAGAGGSDGPWLKLTPYELGRLRKRMKKNATWTPSETMITRELNDLGRGIDAYREAKRRAEEEGKSFDTAVATATDKETNGGQQTPEEVAVSTEQVKTDDAQLNNQGMKLKETKKLKRESLAKQVAEEAEESARRFNETARKLMGPQQPPPPPNNNHHQIRGGGRSSSNSARAMANGKRKRDSATEDALKADVADATGQQRQGPKRTKMETPVPLPQLRASLSSQPLTETPVPPPVLTPGGSNVTPQSTTPVPVPVPGQEYSRQGASPALSKESSSGVGGTVTTTTVIPVKPPAEGLRMQSTTPILPPVREMPKRETRGDAAKKTQEKQQQQQQVQPQLNETVVRPARQASAAPSVKLTSSRASTPGTGTGTVTATEGTTSSRSTSSRGAKATSQEPQSGFSTMERTRRSSTARNTPAPEARLAGSGRKARRPAPGIVSRTTSGGSSAVGRRKKAPSVKKKKVVGRRRSSGGGQGVHGADGDGEGDLGDDDEEMEEVDDEGNAIDPNEPRYCVCNRVSFGTMISCDNANCPAEWFHLECVGLSAIPARTTKWYCPDCRVALNIGEKGEVNARGVKT